MVTCGIGKEEIKSLDNLDLAVFLVCKQLYFSVLFLGEPVETLGSYCFLRPNFVNCINKF